MIKPYNGPLTDTVDSTIVKEALAIWRIFSLVDMITKASNSPNDFKIRLLG